MQDEQIICLPPAVLRAYGEIIRQMARTARTREVVPSLLTLADRFDSLADQQHKERSMRKRAISARDASLLSKALAGTQAPLRPAVPDKRGP